MATRLTVTRVKSQYHTVGVLLSLLRENRNYTLKELLDLANMHQQELRKYTWDCFLSVSDQAGLGITLDNGEFIDMNMETLSHDMGHNWQGFWETETVLTYPWDGSWKHGENERPQ